MWVCFTLIQYKFPKYRQQLLAPLDSTPGPGDLKGIARCDGYHGISWILCGFPYMGDPKNGWFMIEKKTIEMDDSGVPLFVETFLYIFTYNGDVSPEYITCTWIMNELCYVLWHHQKWPYLRLATYHNIYIYMYSITTRQIEKMLINVENVQLTNI